jgi:DNA invertase Pin-like site-specific DNA recombinase
MNLPTTRAARPSRRARRSAAAINSGPRITRVALYLRVSTDQQANKEEGSLETQEARLRQWAASWAGPMELFVYREAGVSGKTLDRPELSRLLADVQAGRLDLVAMTRIDRISRSLLDFLQLQELFSQHNVGVYTLSEQYDTSTAAGKLLSRMMVALGELERENTAERTRVAVDARAQRGLWNGGRPPLGYARASDGALCTVEDEAALVVQLFDRYLEVQSSTKVADWLHALGHRPRGAEAGGEGGRFTRKTVLHMLQNVVYLGKISHLDVVYEGRHPAIITEEVFDAAQRIMDANTRLRGRGNDATHPYLLAGRVRCSCGSALSPSSANGGGGRYHYYRCTGPRATGEIICTERLVSAERLDATVMTLLAQVVEDPSVVDASAEAAAQATLEDREPLARHVEALRATVNAAEARARALFAQLLEAGLMQHERGQASLAAAEAEVVGAREALCAAEAELARLGAGSSRQLQRQGDIGLGVGPGRQGRTLEDEAGAARSDGARDGSGAGRLEPGQQAQGRGLARARGADQGDDLAPRHGQVQRPQRRAPGQIDRRPVQGGDGLSHGPADSCR